MIAFIICSRQRPFVAVVIMCLAIATIACDPGYLYRPRGWQVAADKYGLWSASIGDINLTSDGITGTIGRDNMIPEFTIRNSSDQELILEAAELVTETGRYEGQLPRDGDPESRTVSAKQTSRIAVFWQFDRDVRRVLGEEPQIILLFRLNDDLERITIAYERVE